MNNHLYKLYSMLSFPYRNIGSACASCQDHDCEGYVWLLKEEALAFYDRGIPIVEINESISFIHSFGEVNGIISIEKPRPPCRLRQAGLCSIYDSRPLVCRMYPIGLAVIDDEVIIVLHKDCKFSRDIKDKDRAMFIAQIIKILRQTPDDLLNEIMDAYKKIDAISALPNGPNAFEAIMPLRSLTNERR